MFERFSITAADFLGKGSESEVYALDDARVVRFYRPQVDHEYIKQRLALYDLLHQQNHAFELPRVLEQGMLDDRYFTIEKRMRGRAFADVFPVLEGDDRKRALASYLEVAGMIGNTSMPDRPFGDLLLSGTPTQRDSWSQYLWDRLHYTYRISHPDVEQDVPGVDAILVHMRSELEALEGFDDKRLVHGDYFPGNVFIDDSMTIYGVGDFGYSTIVGDRRMDLAGAVAFLEVVEGYRPSDTDYIQQLVEEHYGTAMFRWLEFYRLYYAFFFSTCKRDDPRTYSWCINSLCSWIAAHQSPFH